MNCNERLVPKMAVPNAMHPRVPGEHMRHSIMVDRRRIQDTKKKQHIDINIQNSEMREHKEPHHRQPTMENDTLAQRAHNNGPSLGKLVPCRWRRLTYIVFRQINVCHCIVSF